METSDTDTTRQNPPHSTENTAIPEQVSIGALLADPDDDSHVIRGYD